jgi:hypothetical protein
MGGFVAPLLGHVNVALTNFAKGFRNNAMLSDIIFPRVPVAREADLYAIWGRRNQQLLQQDLRAAGAGAQRVRRSLSTDSYFCASHALATALPDETRANLEQAGYGYMVTAQSRTQFLQDLILLHKEERMAALLTTTNVTQNTTLAGGDKWTDPVNSDPVDDVNVAKSTIRLSGVEPNTLVLGEYVYNALCRHQAVMEAFKYTKPGSISAEQIRAFFDVQNVHIARAVKVDGSDAASFVFDPEDALLFYSQPAASMDDCSFGKTFVWTGAPGTVGGYGVVIGRDPDITAKTEVLGVDMYYDQKITAVETAYLFKDAGKAM